MNHFQFSKRGLLLAFSALAALVVVACGGGGQEAAAPDGRAMPLGLGLGSAITWSPASVTDTANPGSRQDIPITFTTSANVSNVTVSVVPALQGTVSVAPTSFASLQKGQVATVTLTVAPSATASLGTIEGAVQLRSGGSTVARPLTVTLTLVAPEFINGIAVPPEPPAELNNLTIAGFDANGNRIRDDVERILATQFGNSSAIIGGLTTFARAEQQALVTGSASAIAASDSAFLCFGLKVQDTNKLSAVLLNTAARRFAYKTIMASAPAMGIRELRQSCPH